MVSAASAKRFPDELLLRSASMLPWIDLHKARLGTVDRGFSKHLCKAEHLLHAGTSWLCAIGGLVECNAMLQPTSASEVLEVGTGEWCSLPHMQTPRSDLVAAVMPKEN